MENPQNNAQSELGAPKEKNTLMGILSYIGPLVIVSYLTAKDDPFVKFHIKQGLVLLVIEVAVCVIGTMMPLFWIILGFVNIALFVLSVIGVINVIQGTEKELPLVGKYSKYATF